VADVATALPGRAPWMESRENALEILVLSFLPVFVIALGFAAFSPQCAHWFLIPVVFCGTLTSMDAWEWLRGRLDLMDPIGLMGVVGFHFFFLAPLLHVAWDYWMGSTAPPADWRDWLGAMAALNAISLVAYRFASRIPSLPFRRKPKFGWKLSRTRFTLVAFLLLAVSCGAQLGVYAHFGGVSGYIETFRVHPEAFRGWGWLFVISETFPLMALMAFLVYVRRRGRVAWSNTKTVALLLAFFILQLMFGGLRGSRSNTVWALFCALGMIHFWVRPIRRSLVYVGVVFLVAFLYAYGFYKEYHGAANLNQTLQTAKKHDRSLAAAVLGDLGRADIQAFVLYRLLATDSDYELEWGRTYLGAPALLVPRSIWPDRPPTTVKAGTEIQHYVGSYTPDQFESSRVYGLSGEAMLNFGPLIVPVAFFILGLVVRRVRNFLASAAPLDSRLLVAPLLVEICIWLLIGDSALIMFSFMKQALMPCLVVVAASRRVVAV
jgi:hypothetical protein